MEKTEKEKMLSGELYDASDSRLKSERRKSRNLLKKYNDSEDEHTLLRKEILKELIGGYSKGLYIEPPFYCEYGTNISVGENVFFNFNCVLMDANKISIGARTRIGPNVHIYAASHPMEYQIRAEALELGKPIEIGEDVWISGSVIICPGVSIGDRTVIGAGSIVTKDIPSDCFAAGNPCKVIKELEQ